ncbi:MAG: 3-hydroxyacyl-CoA dehydrogenase family protein [Solirubrobacteraceae bacterium]|nr:3-hydroxyacyl-CoA dehydrogenase family protein [Solirubrobacteraceae bacterium]
MQDERLAIAGTGSIACGLAVVGARLGDVHVRARSESSAERARGAIAALREKLGDDDGSGEIHVGTEWEPLASATVLVEAVAEEPVVKGGVLGRLDALAAPDAIIATTTSSLSISDLARASGRPDRFVGLHVFNPVTRMELVELAFPAQARESTVARASALCEALGKTSVVVPDTPGFVVNRLLFPYLFSAVDFMERHGMRPEDIDECMRLGAGHPMGPLALLDFIGLDVAAAIGREIGVPAPQRIGALVAEGALGRKTGRGFYNYG